MYSPDKEARLEILKLVYDNVCLIPSDAQGPELIKKHYEQAFDLVFDSVDDSANESITNPTSELKDES